MANPRQPSKSVFVLFKVYFFNYNKQDLSSINNEQDVSSIDTKKDLSKNIFEAAINNDLQYLSTYVDKSNMHCLDSESDMTPLQLAIKHNHKQAVLLLIEKGAHLVNLHSKDDSPLHTAVHFERVAIVDILIKNKSAVNRMDYHGNTPLHYAAQNGNLAIVELFLRTLDGADIEFVDMLYNKGVVGINLSNRAGVTPLHLATQKGHFEVIKLLIAYGAIVNSQHMFGETIINAAVRRGDVIILEYLFKSGANINLNDTNPLILASSLGHYPIVKFILNNDPDLDFNKSNYQYENKSALQFAMDKNHDQIVELLNFYIDLSDAAKNKNFTLVKNILIKNGLPDWVINFPDKVGNEFILNVVKMMEVDNLHQNEFSLFYRLPRDVSQHIITHMVLEELSPPTSNQRL